MRRFMATCVIRACVVVGRLIWAPEPGSHAGAATRSAPRAAPRAGAGGPRAGRPGAGLAAALAPGAVPGAPGGAALPVLVGLGLGPVLGRLGGLALRAAPLHLLHGGAIVVEAQIPGAAAHRHDPDPGCLPADRAVLLELEDVSALWERERLVAGVRIVGSPALTADEALTRLAGPDHAKHVR